VFGKDSTRAETPTKEDYAPHSKSMKLGQLAPPVAQLPGFGRTVLTEPSFDFSQRNYTPLPFESAQQLVRVFDEGAANGHFAVAPASSFKTVNIGHGYYQATAVVLTFTN
jgi:hypothetical protein